MSKSHSASTDAADAGEESTEGPAARDEDPFDDDRVAAILDAAWADLQS